MKNKIYDNKLKPVFIFLVALLVFALIILLGMLIKPARKSGSLSTGYITVSTKSSAERNELFLRDGDKNLIDIDGLDKLTDLSVVKTPEGYVINNVFDQVFISPGDSAYSINSNKISDDDNYTVPVELDGKIYADTDRIMDSLGYTTEYNYSAGNEVIELVLTTKDKNKYRIIEVNDEPEKDEIAEMPQIEEGALNPENNNPNRPQDELNTVPRPSVSTEKETRPAQTLPAQTLPAQTEESIPETLPEETEESGAEVAEETEEEVESLPYNPNKKTDEEFDRIWQDDKETLEKIYSNSNANFGQDNFAELSEDTIVFNEASGTVYSNTAVVQHEPLSGEFMIVSFNGDWSDQAANVSSAVSKAYYAGIPEVVRQTLVTTLGETTGTELFNYIKNHADMTITGGYIAVTDETGATATEWNDGEVGNGMDSQNLNLEPWQSRVSDDGLRFDVVRDGSGIKVLIYKD